MAHPTNTQFALAVHVATLLADDPARTRSSEFLAASAGSSPVHVRRVLGALRHAGLATSRPGPNGGWQLARPAAELTLAEIFDAINGDDPVLGIHSANPSCTAGQRIQGALVALEREAAAALRAELARTTLQELAARAALDYASMWALERSQGAST